MPADVPSSRTTLGFFTATHLRGCVVAALSVLLLGASLAQEVGLELVVDGLDRPLGIVTDGVNADRFYVLEQPGTVRIVEDGALRREPFLDLRGEVATGHEQGLLGMAFHPDFPEVPEAFVHYTDVAGDTTLVRMPVDGDRARRDEASMILGVEQPNHLHNGGQLAFGPDGYLYMALGDGGPRNDPNGMGQDPSTLLGTILRLDVNEEPYAVPPDNPFVNREDARDEIWAYGLRNPWRFSFGPEGTLWIGDVGELTVEEVNRERPGSEGGHNYGWRGLEGNECFGWTRCSGEGTKMPLITYERSRGWGSSVTGGYVYEGDALPELKGTYVFGDFTGGTVLVARPYGLTATLYGQGWGVEELRDAGFPISSFGVEPSGELLIADYRGAVWRLVPR